MKSIKFYSVAFKDKYTKVSQSRNTNICTMYPSLSEMLNETLNELYGTQAVIYISCVFPYYCFIVAS